MGGHVRVRSGSPLLAPVKRTYRGDVLRLKLKVEDLEVSSIRAGVVDLGKTMSPR